jgi:hypothetical protein
MTTETLDDLLRAYLGQIPLPRDEAELLVSATRFAGDIAEQPLRSRDLMVFVGFGGTMIASKLAATGIDRKLAHQQDLRWANAVLNRLVTEGAAYIAQSGARAPPVNLSCMTIRLVATGWLCA